jgi:hypothetical protein
MAIGRVATEVIMLSIWYAKVIPYYGLLVDDGVPLAFLADHDFKAQLANQLKQHLGPHGGFAALHIQ